MEIPDPATPTGCGGRTAKLRTVQATGQPTISGTVQYGPDADGDT